MRTDIVIVVKVHIVVVWGMALCSLVGGYRHFCRCTLGYKICVCVFFVDTWLPKVGRMLELMLSSCASSISSNTIRGWLHMWCYDD